MILPEAGWHTRADLAALTEALGADADAVRYVGGAVRDTLLGLPVADVDLATRHPPEETRRLILNAGFKAVPTGIRHGTITAVLPSGPIEVTTLRRDIATDGRHAEVAFTDDWRADAARRDFTINALYASPRDGGVHDYFEGQADLAARRVRFIGDPMQRIAEDHLRILRFFRFHARFGAGAPDPDGLAACTKQAATLRALSRERIRDELLKLLATEDPAATLGLMVAQGILAPVLPGIGDREVARLSHVVRREAALGVPISAERRLGALLPRDRAQADDMAVQLRLSNAMRKRLVTAAAPPSPDASRPRVLAHAIGIEAALDWMIAETDSADVAALQDWRVPRLPLTGGALIARGLTPGPAVAATMQAIERRWVDEEFPSAERVEAIADEEVRARG